MLTPTTALVLRTNQRLNKDGTYPVAYRIYMPKCPTRYIPIGRSEKKYWKFKNGKALSGLRAVKSSHPSYHLFKKKVGDFDARIADVQLRVEQEEQVITPELLKQGLLEKGNVARAKRNAAKVDFFKWAGQWIEETYTDVPSTKVKMVKDLTSEKKGSGNFYNFVIFELKRRSLALCDIDRKLLAGYKKWLLAPVKDGGKGLARDSTVPSKLSNLRTVINAAVSPVDGSKPLLDKSPIFRGYVGTYKPKSHKKVLTISDVARMEEIRDGAVVDSLLRDSCNVVLFMIFCDGLRFSDGVTVKWEDVRNGQVFYRSSKTGKEVIEGVDVLAPMQRVLDEYAVRRADGCLLVFPFLEPKTARQYKQYSTCFDFLDKPLKMKDNNELSFEQKRYLRKAIASRTTQVNGCLKEVQGLMNLDFDLSTKIARNSAATLWRKMGGDFAMNALQHSDSRITQAYVASSDLNAHRAEAFGVAVSRDRVMGQLREILSLVDVETREGVLMELLAELA